MNYLRFGLFQAALFLAAGVFADDTDPKPVAEQPKTVEPEIIVAAKEKNLDRVKKLVQSGGGADTQYGGITPLMYAAYNGDMNMVRFLLEHGADPNHASASESPLLLADVGNYKKGNKSHPEIVAVLVNAALSKEFVGKDGKKLKLQRIPSVEDIRVQIRQEIVRKKVSAGGIGIELGNVLVEDAAKGSIRVYGRVTTFNSVAAFVLGMPEFDHFIITPVADGKWTAVAKPAAKPATKPSSAEKTEQN